MLRCCCHHHHHHWLVVAEPTWHCWTVGFRRRLRWPTRGKLGSAILDVAATTVPAVVEVVVGMPEPSTETIDRRAELSRHLLVPAAAFVVAAAVVAVAISFLAVVVAAPVVVWQE